MPSEKQNCWEYMKCGREPDGANVSQLGVCPAATDPVFDGFNQGINCGRICWLVAGTFCSGKVQGRYAEKRQSCKDCEFYKHVQAAEGITNLHTSGISISALTHIGQVRKTNEDRYLIKELRDGSLLVAVADGLGGEVSGDYAAEITRGKLAGILHIPKGNEKQELSRFVKDIDTAITQHAEADPDLEGMGTTLISVLVRNGTAYWVHVGDSRLYLLREGALTQITEDQTLARFLLEEGEITAEQVPTHYSRHVMDQCVGCGICEPENGRLEIMPGDLLILSSDGLHREITAETMISLLNGPTSLEIKAESMVRAALDMGGKDNITVLIVKRET